MTVVKPDALARRKGIPTWVAVSSAAMLVVTGCLAHSPALAAPADAELLERLRQLEQRLRDQDQRLSRQEKRLAQQEKIIAEQQKALAQRRNAANGPQVHEERAAVAAAPAASTPPPAAAAPQAPPVASAPASPSPAAASQPKRNEPPAIEQIADIGGVLLPKGGLVIEPGLEYIQSSARQVEISGFSVLPAIVIGDFDLRKISRNTFIGSLTSRYGLTDRLEIEGKIPYVYRSDRVTGRPFLEGGQRDVSTSSSGRDVGDVELAAHYQINQGRNDWPYFIGNMRLRAPTGTNPYEVARNSVSNLERTLPTGAGNWALEPSLTMIVPTDPMVFYTNLSYLYNMQRDFGGSVGTIDPGDAFGFSFGGALAVNDRTSFSLGGDFQLVRPTKQNGSVVEGSENLYIGRGVLGFTQKVTDNSSVNLSFTFGVTEDAPNLQLGLRVPITLY